MVISRRTLQRIQKADPDSLEIRTKERPTGKYFAALFEANGNGHPSLLMLTYPRFHTEEEATYAMEQYLRMCRENQVVVANLENTGDPNSYQKILGSIEGSLEEFRNYIVRSKPELEEE